MIGKPVFLCWVFSPKIHTHDAVPLGLSAHLYPHVTLLALSGLSFLELSNASPSAADYVCGHTSHGGGGGPYHRVGDRTGDLMALIHS